MWSQTLRMASYFCISLAFWCCQIALADAPTAPAFSEQWRDILGVDSLAASGIAVADVNADGNADAVFTGARNADTLLFVLSQGPGGNIGIAQALALPDAANIVRVLSATVGGAAHVYTVASDGTVRDYSGWPLAEQNEFTVATSSVFAAIGDLAGGGSNSLLVLTSDSLYAYAASDGSPQWSYPVSGATEMALAQLDADAASEIILNTTPGLVIDGLTLATDWQYIDGFGYHLATGHALGDTTTQFAGATSWPSFSVFRGDPWSPLWSAGSSNGGIAALAFANLDNNNHDVILEGDAQWGSVNAYDTSTQQLRFSIPNPGWGVNAVASADMKGNSIPEIVFGATQAYNNAAAIEAVNSRSGQIDWSFTPQQGPFFPVALGDVDGDGHDELVVAGNQFNYFGPGVITVFDADTGTLKWQSPAITGNGNDPFAIATSRILLLPHNADLAMDIIFAGSNGYDGRIVVMDGATKAVKLQIGSYASGPLGSRYLMDAALTDFDNDGVPDYVAATEPSSTGSSGAELQVFSGIDGHPLWTSVQMGSGFSNIDGVLVTGQASSPSSELIAVLPGSLRAYNIQTRLLDWTLLANANGAAFIPKGVNGAEIAVFQTSGAVTFYDAATQAYLRGFTLPSPVNAITALNGDARDLLIADSGALDLVDGESGTIIASTAGLGSSLGQGNQLAAIASGGGIWNVASGDQFGVARHQLTFDRIFMDGFGN
jgi:hypothetical protein